PSLSCPPPSTPFPYTTLFRSDVTRKSGCCHPPSKGRVVMPRRSTVCYGAIRPIPASWLSFLLPLRGERPRVETRSPPVGTHLAEDRKSTRLNSSHQIIPYAVF